MKTKLLAALLPLLLAATPVAAADVPEPSSIETAAAAKPAVTYAQALEGLRQKVSTGTQGLLRADGHLYALDIGQAMTELARGGDREGYRRLRALAATQLVQSDRRNPYIDGFVAWRIKPGNTPDASGTVEALRIAEGLLAGAEAFGAREDARLANQVLAGYARHGYSDQGLRFVRNYFNFGTRAFSPSSYIANYDLDLALRWNTPEGRQLAQDVRALMLMASRPNGLMNEIVQPEVVAAIPLPQLRSFAPDGVHSVGNSCTVLERALAIPELGRRFLDTVVRAVAAGGPTRAAAFSVPPYLDGKTGMAITRDYPADIAVQGCLARLSQQLAHPQAAAFRLSYLAQLDAAWDDGRPHDLRFLAEVAHTLRTIDGR